MANILLGGKAYTGINSVRLDQIEGGTVDFVEHDTAYEEGRLAGVEEGAKSEYDKFWDAYQHNGIRKQYSNAFCKTGWTDANFRPKYDLILSGYNSNMFWESAVTDLAEALNKAGVILDTSAATNLSVAFAGGSLTRLPEISAASATENGLDYIFDYAYRLAEVQKLILKDDGSQKLVSAFTRCDVLRNITFEGVVGNDINIQWSPLSKESILSVCNALSDSTEGLTLTLSLMAVNNAFETAEGAADGAASDAWLALVNTKPNWTFSLV